MLDPQYSKSSEVKISADKAIVTEELCSEKNDGLTHDVKNIHNTKIVEMGIKFIFLDFIFPPNFVQMVHTNIFRGIELLSLI